MAQLFTMLYVSTLAPAAAISDVATIARTARAKNRVNGISGVLVFDGANFAQMVEGAEGALASLLDRLRHDARHTDVEVLLFSSIASERQFVGWDLGYHFANDEHDDLSALRGLRELSALSCFKPWVCNLDVMAATAIP